MNDRPTLYDILETKKLIEPHIVRTPLHFYHTLSQELDAEIYVKHENHQVLGAFKVRGAVNVMSRLSEAERANGVISSSTGNFGQGIAYAAGIFGVDVHVVVPTNVNPGKAESMRLLGADLILHGNEFDEARLHGEEIASKEGYRYIHSANEPMLTAGTVTKSINPKVRVIGVQAEAAPAAYLSWKAGRLEQAPMKTAAEGLATGVGYEFTQSILIDLLDDFILVSEPELQNAMVMNLEKTHNLTEHAGSAALAAALKIKDELRNKKVALVMSGGNVSIPQLLAALT